MNTSLTHHLDTQLSAQLDRAIGLLEKTNLLLETFMSQITDWAAKVSADLSTVKAGILKLDAEIQTLQSSPGTLGPADQAALDSIAATSAQLAAAAQAPVPPVPPATAP